MTPDLRQATAGLTPGAIRIFGGVNANYWNWQTGTFFDELGVPNGLRHVSRRMTPVLLSDWAELVSAANAIPVFDLNLVTSNLSEQLAMLHAAQDLGMPIKWIELGNEIFLHQPALVRAFPTPQAYGRTATRWIEAIRADFPEAQIAAVGRAAKRAHDKRRAHWNRRLLTTLRGEDALTFHTYWSSAPGRLSGTRLSGTFAAPLRRLSLLHSAGLSRLPNGVHAWLTEWFVQPRWRLRGTWANGLSDAEYLLGMLALPSVRLESLHPLIGRPSAALFGNARGFGGRPATVRYAPTAVGVALGELNPLLSAGGLVSPLKIRRVPRINGTRFAAVRAVAVSGRGALLLNLTGRRRHVRLTGQSACSGTLDSLWAHPTTRITGRGGQVLHRARETHGFLRLPAYSVSRLSC